MHPLHFDNVPMDVNPLAPLSPYGAPECYLLSDPRYVRNRLHLIIKRDYSHVADIGLCAEARELTYLPACHNV